MGGLPAISHAGLRHNGAEGSMSAAHHGLVPDPQERRSLVPEALDVDSVLAPDQLEILMRDPELLGVSEERDLVLRVLGELLEVGQKPRSLHGKYRIRRMNRHEHGRAP